MAVKVAQVKVTSTATALNTAGAGATLKVKNISATDGVDIGPSTVESGKGWTLAKEATDTFELDAGDVLFGIAAAGKEATLAVLST